MIIFEAFQGLENFYIKFQDFPYFSRICTNPGFMLKIWDRLYLRNYAMKAVEICIIYVN